MDNLATLLRCAQFVAHHFHNTVSGPTFRSDHGTFGDFYTAYTTEYDDTIELIIGLDNERINPLDITYEAAQRGLQFRSRADANDMFSAVLTLETTICNEITSLMEGDEAGDFELNEGVENHLQQLANNSLKRQYIIKQRLR